MSRLAVVMVVGVTLAAAAVVLSVGSSASPAQSAEGDIVAFEPSRLLDTRPGEATIDGNFLGQGQLGAGETLELQVAGRADVPADVGTVFLNVVAISPSGRGFLTIHPCDDERPNAASLNYESGSVTANGTIVRIDVAGTVCIFSSQTTHLVADVTGHAGPSGSPTGLVPARLYDSRTDAAASTVDGDFLGGGPVQGGSVTTVKVGGRGGVPVDAESAILNVTAVAPQERGWITVFSCDGDVPNAANLNYSPGVVVGNGALASLDDDGNVCVFTKGAIHLVIDVNAFVPVDGAPIASEPIRLLETRFSFDLRTIDGQSSRIGKLYAGSTTQLEVGGRWFTPDDIDAAFLNVTAIGPEARGFITIFPCGSERPNAASLNFVAGETRANSVLVKMGGGGTACIYSSVETQFVVDLTGWIDEPAVAPDREAPPTTRPGATPDTVVAPPVTAPPPVSATTGAFALSIDRPGFNRIRWNPCRSIRYVVNSDLATPEQIFYMNEGISEFEEASGFDLQYVGQTSGGFDLSVPSGVDADVVLAFTNPELTPRLGGALGLGGPLVQFYSSGQARIQEGAVVVATDQMTGPDQPLVWMHELAHVFNLAHVDVESELMFPTLFGQDDFGPGDRQGLWTVGPAQGCLPPVRSSDRLMFSEFMAVDH